MRQLWLLLALLAGAMLATMTVWVAAGQSDPRGWKQINADGFGDDDNAFILALQRFQGQLYAGTANAATGAQLWRLQDTWTPVITDGFGTGNLGIDSLLEFEGQLYASTWHETAGGEIWRSADGLSWTRVVSQGFGNAANAEVFELAVFSDTLYASANPLEIDELEGPVIWRSNSGDAGSWARVDNAGFDGDVSDASVLDFTVYDGHFYAAMGNWVSGGQVWRTADGLSWAQVNADGFGTTDNKIVSSLAEYNNSLFAAIHNESGAQIWRCQACDGSDWTQVISAGFGDANNRNIYGLAVFGSALFAVTDNRVTGTEVWRTFNGVDWSQVNTDGFGDADNFGSYWDHGLVIYDDRLTVGTLKWWESMAGGEVWQLVTEVTETVQTEGGQVTAPDGAVTVEFPDEAITESVAVTYTAVYSLSAPPTGTFAFAGKAFNLEVVGLASGDIVTEFQKPLTVTIAYEDGDLNGQDEATLEMRYWDDNAWTTDGITTVSHDTLNNRLVIAIDHVTEFALFGRRRILIPMVRQAP